MRKLFLIIFLVVVAPSAFAQNYSAAFTATETPISQGGNWINGGPTPGTGLAWGNVNSKPGLAYGTTVSGAPPYNDSTAVLSGTWSSNQAACGVVFIDPTLNRSGNFEVEIRLRTTVTANSITGYEATYSTQSGGGQYAGFARWNGPLNSFTSIGTLNHAIPSLTSGDSVCASIVGSNLTIWMIHAGVATVANTGSDATYTGGSPGMGFWDFGGSVAIDQLYGFSSFQAANTAALTCNSSDVQTALNAITVDNTSVLIPPGTCTWGTVGGNGASAVIYNQAFSTTIQGSSHVVCTGTPGTAAYSCTDDGGTTIIDHVNHQAVGSGDQSDMQVSTAAGKSFRLTGLTFKQDAQSVQSFHGVALQMAGFSQAVRVDHNDFFHLDTKAFIDYGSWSGVYDHNIMLGTSGSGWTDQNGGTDGHGDQDWADTTSLGTQTGHGWRYFESNYIKSFSNDGINGGRMVYRFNTQEAVPFQTITQGLRCATEPLQTHGTGSNTEGRAMRAFEVYGNYFNSDYYTSDTGMEITSGTGVVFGNIAVPTGASSNQTCQATPNGGGGWHTFMRVEVNRSDTSYTQGLFPNGWGYCGSAGLGGQSGPSPWDQNNPASTGYRCLDAPGTGQSDLLSGNFPNRLNTVTGTAAWPHQASEPIYEWMDSWGPVSGTSSFFWGGFNAIQVQNSDIYLDCSPTSSSGCTSFNGTVGVGHGTLTPTTSGAYTGAPNCTTGVAYWDTAQGNWNQSGNGFGNGVLYKCTATNTWTLFYTPLCYPYPLITGGSCGVVGTPAVTLSPTSVAFGSVLVGSTSPSTTIKLTNSGTGQLNFSGTGITLAGTNPTDFAQTNNCGTAVLAAGSCNIVVTCTPLSAASFSATVSISDNAAGSPQTVPLTCTGTTANPGIGFSPTSIAFASQTVGTSSAPTAITLTNTGSGNLTVTAIVISGGNTTSFSSTNNCIGTLVPAQFCTINVTFTPQVAGALSSSVAVTDNAASSPQAVPLSGTGLGVPAISFTPTSLAFGNQLVGSPSSALSTTVKNTGTGTLTLTSETLTGTNAADYAISANTCGGSLTVGSTCVVSVTFTPGATGSRTANLTFTNNAPASPQQVALSGTGTQAGTGFSPTSLSFGNVNVNSTSAPLTTTLTNTGTATLSIASITITGGQASNFTISSTTCGTTLTASSTCTVSVTATPSAVGAITANLSFADNAPASPQAVPLSVTGIATAISVSPPSLTFPATVVGQISASQAVTLSVSGSGAPVTVSSIAISGGNAGDFSQTSPCVGTINPGSSCTVNVTFKPSATGARASSLAVTDSAPNSPQSVTLSGTGTQSGAQVSPLSVNFGSQPVGTTSSALGVSLTNTGTATLNIASILLGGTNSSYFAISSNTCGTTLAVSSSCTVSLTFTPQTAISASGTLSFTDDGPNSPQVVTLSGLGTFLALSFNPTSLAFGSVNVGTTSAAQTFTMTNNGNGVATISGITIIGTNLGDFSQTNTCGSSLGGGASCTVSVKFLPTASGARSASVQVTDNAPGSPQTVALSGTGVTPTAGISLSPTSLTFATQGVGTSSASQPITVSNPGSGNLVISSVAVSGDYSQTNNCTTVAPAGTCTVNVTFTPTTTGTRTGVLTLSDNAAGSPHTAPLTGTGTAAAVSFVPASLTFPNTALTVTSAALTTTLKNTGGASLTSIVISVTGTNASNFAQTNNCGTSVVAGGSCTINVTFTPSANGVRTANVQVVDNIGTQTVPLQGTGFTPAPAVSLSVSSINFGDQTVSTQSNPHTVVLTNVGTATLTVSAATKTGTNPGDYTVSTSCGSTLAVNAMCSYTIVFIPTAAGSRTATLNVNTNAASSPDLVSLTGNGVVSPQGVPSPQVFGDD